MISVPVFCEVDNTVLRVSELKMVSVSVLLLLATVTGSMLMVNARPQQVNSLPMPYNYEYKVADIPTKNYQGKHEEGNEVGRVQGNYYVWLPDGRLMTVSYFVDGDSGFVPKISFEQNANPLG